MLMVHGYFHINILHIALWKQTDENMKQRINVRQKPDPNKTGYINISQRHISKNDIDLYYSNTTLRCDTII